MATASAMTGAEPLRCLLCSNAYQVPRSLPCKHTFCEECLTSYIESVELQISDSGSKFDCPACRYFVVVPDTNACDIAKGFPSNALYQSLSRSKCSHQTRCDVCLIDKVTTSANAWCIECGEALCSDCCDAHKKVRLTRKHQIIDLKDARQQVLAYSRSNEECPKHPGTMLELFCLNHRELCCALCVPTLHNDCKSISTIDDVAKRVEKHKDKTSFVPEFENMKKEIKNISQQEDLHIGKVDKQYTDKLSAMDTLISQTKNRLDQLYGSFQKNLNSQWNTKKGVLSGVQKETRMLQTNLDNCVEVMSAVTDRASPRQVFVIQEQLKAQLTSHVHEVKTSIKNYKETELQLQTEDAISKIANSILAIGHITEVETPSALVQNAWTRIEESIDVLRQKPEVSLMEDSVSTSDLLGSLVISRPVGAAGDLDLMTATTRKVKSATNLDLGQNTKFTGGTYLPDGRLLLADYGNRRVVMYDDKYNVINKHHSHENPRDIAYSDKHSVVLVRSNLLIEKYNVNGVTLEPIGIIPFRPQSSSNWLSGIAVHDDTILHGTDSFVHMLAMDGTERKRTPRTGNCSYVAVCSERGRFCYTDNDVVVFCKMMDGTEIFRYQDGDLNGIRGVSFDRSGNVYVCCANPTFKVYQISQDGQSGRKLVLDQSDIKRPFNVLYHTSEDKLLVTSSRPDNKVVFEVFEFGDFTE